MECSVRDRETSGGSGRASGIGSRGNESRACEGEEEYKQIEEVKKMGFAEGRDAGFEEGRQSAMTADAFELSFAAGKMAGIADGRDLGRTTEQKRWKDMGHFEDGTCRAFDSAPAAETSPLKTLSPDNISLALGILNWADGAESLPILPVLIGLPPPRDFSGLRSGSTIPFDTLQRRNARYHGVRTRSRRTRQHNFYSARMNTSTQFGSPQTTRQSLVLAPLKGYQRGTAVGVWISGLVLDGVA
ncbi:hypothetical protein B0H13DRAFT_2367158 [Mycena leptocephala]|nr:hypothetical protein B0H13DRAFT_2367158 [Mycena leptocephala]